MDKFINIIIIMILVVALGLLIWILIDEATATKIELIKSNWECTKTESRSWLQPQVIGNTAMAIPQTSIECVEYRRNNHGNE